MSVRILPIGLPLRASHGLLLRQAVTERLQTLLQEEKANAEGFEPLPRRVLETSKVLLDVCVLPSLVVRLSADTCLR